MSLVYAHFDIEADGPTPRRNNMISLGIVFTDEHGKELKTFLGDLKPLKNHASDKKTMTEFWDRDDNNRAELKRIRDSARPALVVLAELDAILKEFGDVRIVWVAMPAAYDWKWIDYYWDMYQEWNTDAYQMPFKAQCGSSMRDMYMKLNKLSWEEYEERVKKWTEGLEMTHNPVDDARYQAKIYFGLMQ